MSEECVAPLNKDSMDEKPCCSTSLSPSSDAVVEKSKKLLGTAKRHLVMGDVVLAVNVFQEACAMLAKKYGDTADECAEAFFLYGKALLELARLENTVLVNALDGVPEEKAEEGKKLDDSKVESTDDVDEETRVELQEQIFDAMSKREMEMLKMENGDKESEASEEKENDQKSPVEDCAVSLKDEMTAEGSETSSEEQNGEKGALVEEEKTPSEEPREEEEEEEEALKMKEGGEEDNNDDDGDNEAEGDDDAAEDNENEEEVGNLQLAWEMLEVAKVIYKRKGNNEDQLMAAQAHLKLGEVSVESGNYSQALEDFQECLAIQLKHLLPHSRMLAETHYQLGLTFGYTNKYSEAIQHFNSSVQVIESCLVTLQEVIDNAEEAESTVEEQKEMDELKQLLPDIREKVEDAQESQKAAVISSEAIQQTLAGCSRFTTKNGGTTSSMATTSAGGASVSASDISHLVRKKRKPEESPASYSDAKKAKQETVLGGSEDASSGSQEQEEHVKPTSPVETPA
ncbi:histone-binding protein N1/N2-like isoform X3 [Arapaima gigas]